MKRPGKRRSTRYAPPQTIGAASDVDFPIRVDRDVYPRPAGNVAAPDAAPNILLVVLGDIGFGVPSGFGGLVETTTFDRLARGGLRYCRFHTAGSSAATRTSLLTGRNHGGMIPFDCATVVEVLRQNGYATGWWGRCDTVPPAHASDAGPFDRWPSRIGFEHFYGVFGGVFGGHGDQFRPALFRHTSAIDAPRALEHGYHLTTDLTNDCIAWVRSQKAIAPDRPLFAYFAPLATQQPPLERRGRREGRFSFGWDEYRHRVYERQLELGVIPRGARLSERPPEITPWSGLSDDDRMLFTRFVENYAECVEHADAEVGRVIEALDELAELENTLVIYLAGDRGCGEDGGVYGTLNVQLAQAGGVTTPRDLLAAIDQIGAPGTTPYMPAAWSWAGITPFQAGSLVGATRTPMVMYWPRRILAAGGLRHQFHHVTDLAPTILEVVGIRQPETVNGVAQRAIDGVGMSYTFAADRASAPDARRVQHFVCERSRGVYVDGWFASATGTTWELYDGGADYSHTTNLAEREPQRLRALQDMLIAEVVASGKHEIDSPPAASMRRRIALFPGMTRVPEACMPDLSGGHTVAAIIDVPRGGAEGAIVCAGGEACGWSLYVWNRRLVYHYNFFNHERTDVVSDRDLPIGHIEVKARVECIARGGATVALLVDGELVGRGTIPRRARAFFGSEGVDVGIDRCSPVSAVYRDRHGFPFTGTIERVTLEVESVHSSTATASAEPSLLATEPTDEAGPARRS